MNRRVLAVLLFGTLLTGVRGFLAPALSRPVSAPQSEDAGCRRASRLYLEQLADLAPWALRMFDSSAKVGSGFFRGNTDWLGDYEQCLAISGDHVSVSGDHVSGKYCLAAVHVSATWPSLNRSVAAMLDLAQAHNFINVTLEDKVLPMTHPGIFLWGVCVPSACHEGDVEGELARRLPPSPLLSFNVRVYPGMCQTARDKLPISTGAVVAMLLVSIPALLSLAAWLLAALVSRPPPLLAALSFGRNWRRLFDLSPDTDSLRCVHGIRVLFVLLLYCLHKAVFIPLYPIANKIEVAELMDQQWTVPIRAFWNFVDTFFLLSGLLTAYYAAKKLKEGKKLNLIKMYIRRYYKFTGLFVVVVLFFEHLQPRLISGPMALRSVSNYSKLCHGKSWSVFTYLAIFDGVENMCFGPSNHLILDMHMYLLAPLIVRVMWHRPRASTLATLIVLAVISAYKVHVLTEYNLPPVLYTGISYQTCVQMVDKLLFSSVLRFPSYLIGVALGVLLQKIDCKMSLPKPLLIFCHVLSGASALYCLAGPAHVLQPGYEFRVEDTIVYGLLQPLLWPLALAWTILACATGNANFLSDCLSRPVFTVGSRLSYAFNLVQMPIMLINLARVRVPVHFSMLSFIDLHELLVVFSVSVFLTVVFLAPLGELWEIFTGAGGSTADPKNVNTKERKQS